MSSPASNTARDRPRTLPAPDGAVRTSIVLATLNERSNLPDLLDRIDALRLPATEILVVDDGSVDGTREFVTARSSANPGLRLLRHEGKQTTLRAQCQGIEAAHGACIVVMDADLQHPPELIPQLLEALEQGAALSIASRYARGGSAGPRTVFRWTLSRGAEGLTKILLPSARGVADPVSGYFAFRRDLWIPLDPLYRGYKLLIFLLVMAEGRTVREIGFRFVPRREGASKVTGGTAFLRVFVTELILAHRLRARLQPSRKGTAASSPTPLTFPR